MPTAAAISRIDVGLNPFSLNMRSASSRMTFRAFPLTLGMTLLSKLTNVSIEEGACCVYRKL